MIDGLVTIVDTRIVANLKRSGRGFQSMFVYHQSNFWREISEALKGLGDPLKSFKWVFLFEVLSSELDHTTSQRGTEVR